MLLHKVFVIWTNPLFFKSVGLLMKHPGISIVGSTTIYEKASRRIRRLQPDTILIEKTEQVNPQDVMALLDACFWKVRVMLLSLEDNQLKLYAREQKAVGHANDLLTYVLNDGGKSEEISE